MNEDDAALSWLRDHGAHHDVIEWARCNGASWSVFWSTCPRGDWLIGVAARAGVASEVVIGAALSCVPVLEPYLPEREPALQRALSWVQQQAVSSANDVDGAQRDNVIAHLESLLARCSDASAHAAVWAMVALVQATQDPAHAASFVVATVQAAVMDAGDCGMIQAARFTEHECARLVRGAIDLATLGAAIGDATRARG